MEKAPELTTYSIGLEELALALGLVNALALSRELLESLYPEDPQELTAARLASAGHSLLASGLCRLTETGALHLEPDFERAIFPLVKYQSYINVQTDTPDGGAGFSVSLSPGGFTSRVVHSGAVQVLTHGSVKDLPAHLASLLPEFGEGGRTRALEHGLTPALLKELTGKDAPALTKLLGANGWPEKDALALAADLAAPRMTATLVHVHADDQTPPEEIPGAKTSSLLLLRGAQDSWAVHAAEVGQDSPASVQLVDRTSLEALLAALVA